MKDHSEFPTKPNYQAIAESLEAENKILTQQVELQTKRLQDLQQAVKDAADKINKKSLTGYRVGIESNDINSTYTGVGLGIALDILTEKTGITA